MEPVTDAKTPVGEWAGKRIERILCPFDFSEASVKAYRYAQSIARHDHATLVVEHTVELAEHSCGYYASSAHGFEEFCRLLIANGRQKLQQFLHSSGGIEPECVVEEGMAADAILSLARQRAVSLIVMGTHGRRGFDHLMLGSVTERVLRHASCPVLAVHETAPDSRTPSESDEPAPLRRIVCCVNFSAHSERALEYALSIADAYDAELTGFHALDDVPGYANVGQETAAAMEKLEKLVRAAVLHSAKTHLEVRLGKPYQEILKFASEHQSDLIVTGVRGRHSLSLAVFGSTTYRVIQLGLSPVLTVPI